MLSHVENSLSFGEPKVRLDIEELKFIVEDTERVHGYSNSCTSLSSTDRHVSTIASRQFTNNSALSRFDSDLEKGPAKRHKPPNPKAEINMSLANVIVKVRMGSLLCKQCDCCCGSSLQRTML